jgi:hypothetical protein
MEIKHEQEQPSIGSQYIKLIKGKRFVLYAGLLDLAHQSGLVQLLFNMLQSPNDNNGWTCIMHARTVWDDGRVFEEIGDATPQNTTRMVADHYIRVAATRAKARALRDALNIDMVASVEMGDDDDDLDDQPRDAETRDAGPRPPEDMARPVYRGRPDPVTTKQIELIKRLALQAERSGRPVRPPFDFSTMTKRQASDHITELQGGN